MNPTPTPDEAQQALREVEQQQARSVAAATQPRWVWIVAGLIVAAWGVLADRVPDFTRIWGNTLVILMLLVVVLGNSRWGGSLLGRTMRPRTGRDTASMLWFGLVIVLFVGGLLLARSLHTPHLPAWGGLAGGLLLAVAGPWWQRRVLTREARR